MAYIKKSYTKDETIIFLQKKILIKKKNPKKFLKFCEDNNLEPDYVSSILYTSQYKSTKLLISLLKALDYKVEHNEIFKFHKPNQNTIKKGAKI